MTSTENAVGMEAPLGAGMHNEGSAVERLEELARAATPGNWRAWTTRRRSPEIYTDAPADREPNDLVGSTLRKADAAYIAAANPQAILSLIESLRHSVEREAGLREALEPFAKDCDRQERDWTFRDDDVVASRTAVTIGDLRKARAALGRRAGT